MEREEKLIRKILRRGDRKAAGELVEKYYDDIFYLVARQTGESRETVLDLTQDIFFFFLSSLAGYNSEKAAFRTWLYRIATNKIVDRYRSKVYRFQRDSIPFEEQEITGSLDLSSALEDRETAEEILGCIALLPAETQEILRLHIFAEQTFDTIAEMVGIPAATVKTRYYRAVEKIRKEMAP